MRHLLSSGPVRIIVDLDRGADIVSYVDDRIGGELLWSPASFEARPQERVELGHNTQVFYDDYRGGIQELFPNTADATTVLGAELPFHGELCRTPMESIDQSETGLTATAHLKRFPVSVTRTISVSETGEVTVRSVVKNLSSRELPYSWGLHPVFSEQLTGEGSVLWCHSRKATSHPTPFANFQLYPPGAEVSLQKGRLGDFLPLSPKESGTADLVYIDLEENWFQLGIPNQHNIALRWSNSDFKHLWFWQECHGRDDWPWWGQHHVVGIEPHTSAPATSLAEHVREGSALVLPAKASAEVEFVFAVLPGPDMER